MAQVTWFAAALGVLLFAEVSTLLAALAAGLARKKQLKIPSTYALVSSALIVAAGALLVLRKFDLLPELLSAQRAHGQGSSLLGSVVALAWLVASAGLAIGLERAQRWLATKHEVLARLALPLPGAVALLWALQDTLASSRFFQRVPDTLTPDSTRPWMLAVPLAVLGLGLALRLAHSRVTPWLLLGAEVALVPLTYALGVATIFLSLQLTELELWDGFKFAAFWSAAVFALPIAVVPGRLRARGFAIVMLLFALITYGDLIYLRYFGNILPVLAVSSGGQIWDVRDIIFKYTQRGDAWLLPWVIAAIATWFLWPRTPAKAHLPLGMRAVVDVVLVVGCLVSLGPVRGLVDAWMKSDRSWRVLNGTDAVQSSGYVVAHIKEVARSIRDSRTHSNITAARLAFVKRYHAERAQESHSDPEFGVARGTNLLIIQVEAMQEWVVGGRYRGQEITPFLNQLREHSLYFSHLFDETGDSSTSDCEYMVLNSQFPIPEGSVAFRRDENHFFTLLHAFKEAGYTTFAGHAYAAGMWNRGVLYPKYGFDQTAFRDEIGPGPKMGWGIGDKLFFERVEPRVAALKRPFVSILITLTSHGPFSYVPVREHKLQLAPQTEAAEFGNYLHSMRYNDEAIELLMHKLAEQGLLDNTTVIIYGDHDSRIKYPLAVTTGLELPREKIQRLTQRDYTTKQIPLIVALPTRLGVAPRVVTTIGGQVDIGATIAHLFGLHRPASFIGQSLLPERPGHASRIDGSGVNDQLIYTAPGGGRCETFPDWSRLPRSACDELARRTQEELNVSWDVTLQDLATQLTGKQPPKSAAQR
ncbi:MAG TPA: LTA synthase family protein [Polyangiaceae bacterium]